MLRERLRALLSQYDSPLSDFRRVMMANLGAALGLSIGAIILLGLGFPWVGAFVAPIYALLTLCLLGPYTFWIPAALVGAVVASLPAMVLGGLVEDNRPGGGWLTFAGAIAGFALGFVIVVRMYQRVSALARSKDQS